MSASHGRGFVALHRGQEAEELMKDPLAFTLLSLVAMRARWKTDGFSALGLEPGEALIGDHASIGATRAEYRRRLKKLREWGFLTIRITNKGTIAKLVPGKVWSVSDTENDRQKNQPVTSGEPAKNQPATTEEPAASQRRATNEQGNKGNQENKGTIDLAEPLNGSPSVSGVASHPHREFIDRWIAAYPAYHQGQAYAFQAGKDGKAVKQLLATARLSPADLMAVAVEAWGNPGSFHCQSAASLAGFNSRFNEIRAELQKLRSGGGGNGHRQGGAAPPRPTGAYTARSAI